MPPPEKAIRTAGGNDRAASISFHQKRDGYWYCAVEVWVPRFPNPVRDSRDLFHDAGECMEWARQRIEAVTLSVSDGGQRAF